MSITVLIEREIEVSDLAINDRLVDVLNSSSFDPTYELECCFYPGEPAVTNALPENCHPGGCDEWELNGTTQITTIACSLLEPVRDQLSVEDIYFLVAELIEFIQEDSETDNFFDLVIEKGNEAANEEPEPPERDDDDMDWQDHYERLD